MKHEPRRTAARRALLVRIEERFHARVKRLVDLARQKDYALAPNAGELALAIARHFTALIEQTVDMLVERKPDRHAVLDRTVELVDGWDLLDHGELTKELALVVASLVAVEREQGDAVPPAAARWPSNVAGEEVFRALSEALMHTKDRDAIALARAIDSGAIQWSADTGYTTTTEPDEAIERELRRWSVLRCAYVVSVAKRVRQDAARRMIPVPASQKSRTALLAVSSGSGPSLIPIIDNRLHRVRSRLLHPEAPRPAYMLFWRGKAEALQLGFDFGEEFDEALVRGILNELHEDGLRDYLVLHRMAAEQGRTGAVRWTWREHRERTPYARRIHEGHASDEEVAFEVERRIWRLKGAELFRVQKRNVVRPKVGVMTIRERIGPFGLIDIQASATVGNSLELALVTLNPEIYKPAAYNTKAPYFALLPDEALLLDGRALRLATMIALSFRVARDNGGEIVRSARALWEYMLADGGRPAEELVRHRWPRLDLSLAKALERLAQAGVIGAWVREEGAADPLRRYTINPPQIWRDQILHGVQPELPPARTKVPRTVGEMRLWRAEKKLTQAAAALALGVGLTTVKRGETGDDATPLGLALGEAFLRLGADLEGARFPTEEESGEGDAG